MNKKLQDCFVFSVAVMLFVTAVVKLFSAMGTCDALNALDPLIPIPLRYLFLAAAVLELVLSAFLLVLGENTTVKLCLIIWLASTYACYWAGLLWIGAPNYFNCPGYLNDHNPLSPRVLWPITLAMLVWMIGGSYAFLIMTWFRQRKLSRRGIVPATKGNLAEA